jgi:rhodanese-related sulfurtransferase
MSKLFKSVETFLHRRLRQMRSTIGTAPGSTVFLALAVGAWLATGIAFGAEPAKSILEATLAELDQKTPEVSTGELRRILSHQSARVLDARPHKEYAMGHIPGALNVAGKPGVAASQYVPDVTRIEQALGGNKSTPIVVYCSGPFCGRSKRVSEELVALGFTNVCRYQLGIPVWRAMGGTTQIELDAAVFVHAADRSAVFVDARDPEDFRTGSVPRAVNLPANRLERGKNVGEVQRAKDDGRLPMEDHNTRIIVFGRDSAEARIVAEAVTGEAFHNVAFYGGTFDSLRQQIK